MGMHKYISKIRTKSGKWRYIYKDVNDGERNNKGGDPGSVLGGTTPESKMMFRNSLRRKVLGANAGAIKVRESNRKPKKNQDGSTPQDAHIRRMKKLYDIGYTQNARNDRMREDRKRTAERYRNGRKRRQRKQKVKDAMSTVKSWFGK